MHPSENPIVDDALLSSLLCNTAGVVSVELYLICIPNNPKFVAGLTDLSLNCLLNRKTVHDFSLNTFKDEAQTALFKDPVRTAL